MVDIIMDGPMSQILVKAAEEKNGSNIIHKKTSISEYI